MGGQIKPILHALFATHGHKAWLYVDDFLGMLARTSWEDQVILVTFLRSAIDAPTGAQSTAMTQHRLVRMVHASIPGMHTLGLRQTGNTSLFDSLREVGLILNVSKTKLLTTEAQPPDCICLDVETKIDVV